MDLLICGTRANSLMELGKRTYMEKLEGCLIYLLGIPSCLGRQSIAELSRRFNSTLFALNF